MQDVIRKRKQIDVANGVSERRAKTLRRIRFAFALISPLAISRIFQFTSDSLDVAEAMIVRPSNGSGSIERRDSEPRVGLEFHSPMKRIMELVGNQAPVIMVGDGQRAEEMHHAHQHQPMSYVSSSSMVNKAPTRWVLSGDTIVQQSAEEHPQHSMQFPHQTNHQQQQHQQHVFADSVPLEQYYQQIANSDEQPSMGQHISLMPSQQLSFSPEIGQYQQVPSIQYTQEQQVPVYQSGHVQQQQPSVASHNQPTSQQSGDSRGQPIFLSSYVPATSRDQQVPSAKQPTKPIPRVAQESEPQEEQQSANDASGGEQETEPSAHSEFEPQPEADPQSGSSVEGGSSETDIEEPAKIRRDQEEPPEGPGADEGDSPNDGSGSISYEDKYDSDKDEPRYSSSSERASATPSGKAGEPAPIIDGLVNVGLNEDCLQCICRASSGCDHQLRCITRGSEERYCGPFQLTEDYWTSAGSPGDASNNFSSFEDCANEADCAVETVTNYMKKYHKDCDNDENITCMDYARLHILKPDECDNTEKLLNSRDAYWAKFQRCAEGYNRSRTGDDEDI